MTPPQEHGVYGLMNNIPATYTVKINISNKAPYRPISLVFQLASKMAIPISRAGIAQDEKPAICLIPYKGELFRLS